MATGHTVDSEAVTEYRRGEFLISTSRDRLDLDVIHEFLTNCYWAKGIPREVVARSVEHSLCFGVYDGTGEKTLSLAKGARHGAPGFAQVGFARIVSDFATVAYLGDVFVLESHRGHGLGKWLMECIMRHTALQNLRRWILFTLFPHGLSSQFGFTPVKAPERYRELHRADVYETRKIT